MPRRGRARRADTGAVEIRLNTHIKVLTLVAIACGLVVLLTIGLQVYLLIEINSGDGPNPLRYSNPQQVIQSQVTYKPGDILRTIGTKCNSGKAAVFIGGESVFEKTTGTGSVDRVRLDYGTRLLDPGCLTRMFAQTLPTSLSPGPWRLVGRDCLPNGRHCADWFTETFVVVAP